MSRTEVEAVVNDYFRRLEALLTVLPAEEREQLLGEIRAHVAEARAGLGPESVEGVREMLDRVGRPEEIAAEAFGGQAAQTSRRNRRVPVIAAVVLVAVIGAVLGFVLTDSSGSHDSAAAPTVAVGGFPTGVAVDPVTATAYVASGEASALSLINGDTCNASTQSGCAGVMSAPTGGQDAIGVAIDTPTHTVYAVNGSGSLAVFDESKCNATVPVSGCTKPSALVSIPGGPEFLAVNEKTDTVYVADTDGGTVSVIDGRTCNAADTRGCSKPPAEVTVGSGPFPIAVDEQTNTIYVGTLGGAQGLQSQGAVYVINGGRCDAADMRCRVAPKPVVVGAGPSGIAVDDATGTVYVSSESGTVSLIDAKGCTGTVTTSCAKRLPAIAVGNDARGDLVDDTTGTLYVTDAGSNSVSMINTAGCNAQNLVDCRAVPPAFPVGASPRRLALDTATHTLYVVNVIDNTVSVIDTRRCNAGDTHGCPTQSPRSSAAGSRMMSTAPIANVPAQDSSCSPTTNADTSGGAASTVTTGAEQVASGTIAGQSWSLWSKKGQTGADALENAGLVVNGHAYGLCPGYPNPAELELLDLGKTAVVFGVIGYPGKAKLSLSVGRVGTFTPGKPLPSPGVQVVNGVSFFIGTLPNSACAYKALELDSTSPGVSAEHDLGFGGCTTNKLVPITFSQGIWQLEPGKFVNNFSSGPSMQSVPTANVPLQDSSCSPATNASASGASATMVTAGAHQVASGTIAGQSWSLWSKKGQTGANALEDAGLVVDGHAYGLCPGYPNPAELELLNLGKSGIVYGVIGYPGKAKIKLTTGTIGTFTPGSALPSPAVRAVNGVSFFIGTLPKSACAYKALELDSTSPGVSAEHNLGFGGCTSKQIVPITFSQGIWQLKPGKFVNNFPGESGSGPGVMTAGGGNSSPLTTTFESCNASATSVQSGKPAGPLTRDATKVASGIVDGHSWSLWADKTSSGMSGIENGGVVLDSRWYGLCAGYPNPAEFELIDAKPAGIAYGYVANPGPYAITLSPGEHVPRSDVRRIRGGSFFIAALPHEACTYNTIQLNAVTPTVNDLRYQQFGSCKANQLVQVEGGHGEW